MSERKAQVINKLRERFRTEWGAHAGGTCRKRDGCPFCAVEAMDEWLVRALIADRHGELVEGFQGDVVSADPREGALWRK